MDLFKLVGKLSIEGVEEANKSIDGVTDKGEKAQGKLSKAFSAVGKGAAVVGKTIGTGLAVGGAAMGALTVKALNLGGELEQNMGGSEAVFKNYAGKMQETAKTAFSEMGLSTSDFLATANKMGALFQGAGFSIKESSDLSASAMQRAADVASIMGLDTSAAMEAVAGAAKGNFTMMDNLGVAMNDTTLNAYALEKGIGKTTKEMTNQEKIGLAMELFMDKTAYAAGNYAKENETLAGSLGTAKSALTNFLDGSGDVEGLVTSFTNVAKVIVKNLKEIAPRLVTGLVDIINQLVPQIPPLLQQLLPVIINGAVSLLNGLVSALPQVLSVLFSAETLNQLISGVTSIIGSLCLALPQILEQLVSVLPSLIETVLSALIVLTPQIISSLVQMAVIICQNFSSVIQPIIDMLPELIVMVVTTLLENLPILLLGIGQLIIGIIQAIPQLLSALWESITTLASQAVSKLFGKIKEWIQKLFPQSADTILKILNTIKDYFSMLVKNIGAILSVVVSIISTPFKLAWNGIKFVWDTVKAYFKMVWNNIKAIFSVVDSVLSGDFKGAWEGIKKIWSNVTGFFKDIWSNIKKSVANVGEILTAPFRKGKEAIGKIVDNIKGFFTNLKIRFPKIPMPHFGIKPKGWKIGDLLKGEIPKLNIDWYAKAMNNPLLLNKPTIFGYDNATGNLLGGGEAGAEVVAGANTLMGMIQKAVSEQNSTLTYYMSRLLEVLAAYFPQILDAMNRPLCLDSGALVGGIAEDMDTALGKIRNRKDRGR